MSDEFTSHFTDTKLDFNLQSNHRKDLTKRPLLTEQKDHKSQSVKKLLYIIRPKQWFQKLIFYSIDSSQNALLIVPLFNSAANSFTDFSRSIFFHFSSSICFPTKSVSTLILYFEEYTFRPIDVVDEDYIPTYVIQIGRAHV